MHMFVEMPVWIVVLLIRPASILLVQELKFPSEISSLLLPRPAMMLCWSCQQLQNGEQDLGLADLFPHPPYYNDHSRLGKWSVNPDRPCSKNLVQKRCVIWAGSMRANLMISELREWKSEFMETTIEERQYGQYMREQGKPKSNQLLMSLSP